MDNEEKIKELEEKNAKLQEELQATKEHLVNKHSNKTNKPDLIVDPKIQEKFIENNKLDYMLYEIVKKVY